jgi:hypothetical protein
VVVRLHRLVTAAATIVVAIVLAVFVPVAQLQTIAVQPTCCCPDPHTCKCPEHKPADPVNTTMRACHNAPSAVESTQLPQFIPPAIACVDVPSRAIAVAPTPLPEAHPAPVPHRPDAPS